ncbi:MAG: DMT family transporter, partial [Paracoccaceae bacterium]
MLAGGRLRLSAEVLFYTALRTVLHILGIGAMFLSLRYLPLADAVAIAFVMPFIMLLLGKTVLGEAVGAHRLGAVVVGFGGTLLVIQPNFANVGAPALLPLMVAVVFALFMLVTRKIAKRADPVAMQAVSGLMATAVLGAALVLAPDGWAELRPAWPGARDLVLLGVLGVIGTGAHLLMTASLRFAPAASLAPMQYLEIPVATLIGWLVFRDFPDGIAAAGIVVTILAGLYVIRRERLSAATVPAPHPAARRGAR